MQISLDFRVANLIYRSISIGIISRFPTLAKCKTQSLPLALRAARLTSLPAKVVKDDVDDDDDVANEVHCSL